MRFRSTIFALAATAWSGSAERAWAITGCDAFSAALRTEASDMQVEFGREPANARTNTNFERFQTAALKAALGWDAGKSRGVLRAMTADAREYLAASRERGDVYVAGKTEEHQPGGVSLGLMATGSDRTFVIVGPAGE